MATKNSIDTGFNDIVAKLNRLSTTIKKYDGKDKKTHANMKNQLSEIHDDVIELKTQVSKDKSKNNQTYQQKISTIELTLKTLDGILDTDTNQNQKNQKKRQNNYYDSDYDNSNYGNEKGYDPYSAYTGEEIQKKNQQLQQQMSEQDELLDQISVGLDKLKQIGLDMNKELDEQDTLITGLNNDVDDQLSHLGSAQRRLNRVYKEAKKNTKWIILGVLALIAVGLLIAVILLI